MANEEYLELITSEYADKPKFVAYVNAFLEMLNPAREILQQFDFLFDLDREFPSAEDPDNPEPGTKESTVDDQLDVLGILLNVSRALPVVDEDIPTVLDNETYQKVLKSKVLFNHWNGTREGLAAIIERIYPDIQYEITDNQDMTYDVIIINPSTSSVDEALLANGFILPKPSGVRVNYSVTSAPFFGWDSNTSLVKGWDLANWRSV